MRSGHTAKDLTYGRAAALLTAAIGASGVLTYIFFALASHALDREDYGRVVVLWSVLFVGVSVLCRPVEQLLARSLAEHRATGRDAKSVIRVAAQIQAGILLTFLITSLLLRDQIQDGLFEGDPLFFWALVGAVVGFGVSFFARGALAGSGRFVAFSVIVLVDAASRTAFAVVVAVGISSGPDAIALGIAIAPAISVLAWPLAGLITRERRGQEEPDGSPVVLDETTISMSEGGEFAAAMLLVMVSEQVILNGGPLFARAADGTVAAGFIFNVLMVLRAPVLIFQAAATTLLPHLTRLNSHGPAGAKGFRDSIRVTLAAICGFAVLTTVVALVAGPTLMQIAFGDSFEYDRLELAIIGVGMGFYLTATTLSQAVVAQNQVRRAAACWIFSAVALLAWFAVPIGTVLTRIEIGVAGTSALLGLLLYLVYRTKPRPETFPVASDARAPVAADGS